jgi:hypothetical protein
MSSTKGRAPYSEAPICQGLHAAVGVSDDLLAVLLFNVAYTVDGTRSPAHEVDVLGFHRHPIAEGFPAVIAAIRQSNPYTLLTVHLPVDVVVDDFEDTILLSRRAACPIQGLMDRAARATQTSHDAIRKNTGVIKRTIQLGIESDDHYFDYGSIVIEVDNPKLFDLLHSIVKD